MLAYLFDRFYIVTKFMLPSMGDIKFSNLYFDHSCAYINKEYAPNTDSRTYLTELKTYCNKINVKGQIDVCFLLLVLLLLILFLMLMIQCFCFQDNSDSPSIVE